MRHLIFVVLVACGGYSSNTGTIGTQTLLVQSAAGAALHIAAPGGTLQLQALQHQGDVYGSSYAPVSATWSSSDTSVATVDGSGMVSALSAGTTIVTASSGGASGNATVTVGGSAAALPDVQAQSR